MSSLFDTDTIAAIATAPGRGGVAVIRVSGPAAFAVASALTGRDFVATDAGRFFRAIFRKPDAAVLDDGLCLVFAAPRSYTGEDVVEFQTHGGSVTPRRVLEAALAAGARLARRGEFTQRAFLNGRMDLTAAEAVIDLIDAKTARAADEAVARLGGALRGPCERLYADALALSADLEHALDFDEGELPDDFTVELRRRLDGLEHRVRQAAATAREGKILREGALVVLAGKPNAGKSSLLNALLGEARAIVSPVAGTTRDSIEETLELDGWPVRLVDTAGLRETCDAVESEGVARSERLIATADLVIDVIDGTSADEAPPGGEPAVPLRLAVMSKADLTDRTLPGVLPVSSKTGAGLAQLKGILRDKIATLAARRDEASGADVTTRQRLLLETASGALDRGSDALAQPEYVVAANELHTAADTLGRLVGKVYSDELLDAVFSRFCVGK